MQPQFYNKIAAKEDAIAWRKMLCEELKGRLKSENY